MDKKALIAVIVCGIIMILYYPFILPLMTKKAKVTEELAEEVVPQKIQEIKTAEPPRPLPAQELQPQTAIPAQEVVLENEFVKTVWTNEGAALKTIQLKHFKDAEAKNVLNLLKTDVATEYHPLVIDSILQQTNFHRQRYHIAEHRADKIVFTVSLGDGINLVKTVTMSPGKYHVSMDIAIENTTNTEASAS